MEYTSLIFPGDKIDIFASGLSDNSTSYKSSFSDKLTDSMWEITMPVDSGRVVLFQLGTQFDFIIYTQNKTILKSSAIVRQRYRKENMYFLAIELINNLEKIQRRQFFRLPCTIDMDFYEVRYDDKAESELVLTGDEVFTAYWKKDEPVVNHTLTVTGGTFAVKNGDIDVTDTLETSTDEASGKQTCLVPDGAEVTVTLDQTKVPEGMVFDLWSTGKFELPLDQDYKAESIAFTMNDDVDVAAQYRSADIEDGSDVVGPIIVGTAVVAGGALVGYTLGTDLVGQMWGLPYFPSNRSALAMMLWEDAGKPMPESEILYPDVGQEEQDMDLQHAARWSMEHDLMPDLNDQDTELPPEQVKFYPDNMVTKISVLRAWKKAQDLKQNAQ